MRRVCVFDYISLMSRGCFLELFSNLHFSLLIIHHNRFGLLLAFNFSPTSRSVTTSLIPFSDISVGLRDVRVVIPVAVKRGANALLICNYDMEGDSMYSIKWYKGKREFYRYTPKDPQSIKTFPVAGISVEVSLNNEKGIKLHQPDDLFFPLSLLLSRQLYRTLHRLWYRRSIRTCRADSRAKVGSVSLT